MRFLTIKGQPVVIDEIRREPPKKIEQDLQHENVKLTQESAGERIATAILKCAESSGLSLEKYLLANPRDYELYRRLT